MSYPRFEKLDALGRDLALYAQLKHEYGAEGIAPVLGKVEAALREARAAMKKLR